MSENSPIYKVFTGKDGGFRLTLKNEDGTDMADHTVVQRLILQVGIEGAFQNSNIDQVDSQSDPDSFDLTIPAGVNVMLGDIGLPNGRYLCRLITFVESSVNGYAQPDPIEIEVR